MFIAKRRLEAVRAEIIKLLGEKQAFKIEPNTEADQISEITITAPADLTPIESNGLILSELLCFDPHLMTIFKDDNLPTVRGGRVEFKVKGELMNNALRALEIFSLFHAMNQRVRKLKVENDTKTPTFFRVFLNTYEVVTEDTEALVIGNKGNKRATRSKLTPGEHVNRNFNLSVGLKAILLAQTERNYQNIEELELKLKSKERKYLPYTAHSFQRWLAELKIDVIQGCRDQSEKSIDSFCKHARLIAQSEKVSVITNLNKALDATLQALTYKTPANLDNLLKASKSAQGSPHRGLQALGVAMAALGVALIVTGALFFLTSLIPLPHIPLTLGLGAGAISLGAGLTTGGISLFAKERKKGMAKHMEQLHARLSSAQVGSR